MKIITKHLLTAAIFGVLAASPLRAHTPPTDGQIGQALANPGMVNSLVVDANPEESAAVLIRLLQRIHSSDIAQSQKNFLASYYTARITFLLGNDAAAMAEVLLPDVPAELLPAVWSGLSVGGRGSASVMAALRDLAGDDAASLQAIDAPNLPLSDPIYNQLLTSLGASQSLPPVVTDSLPPPVPVGTGREQGSATPTPSPPPPVPEPYAGQS